MNSFDWPYRYVSFQGKLYDPLTKKSLGIEVMPYAQVVNGSLVAGYSVDRKSYDQAEDIFKKQFPKAKLAPVKGGGIATSNLTMISGFGYPETGISVNGVLVVHPLDVLVRDYSDRAKTGELGMSKLADDIQHAVPGLLADIL